MLHIHTVLLVSTCCLCCRLQLLPTSNVGSFFRQQQAVATHSHWQLLQLAPSPTPGVFRLWALVDSGLYCVPLHVSRVVVVNSEEGLVGAAAAQINSLGGHLQACKAVLPPGDVARALDQVRVRVVGGGRRRWSDTPASLMPGSCALWCVKSSCVANHAGSAA